MIEKKNIVGSGTNRGYWTHPLTMLEEKLIIKGEELGKELRTEGKAWGRIITPEVLRHIKESKENKGNTIIGLLGPAGRGKTQIALSILKYCYNKSIEVLELENPEIFLVFSKTELSKVLSNITFGGVGFQDEDLEEVGIDSNTMKDSIKNAREVFFRVNQFDFLIASANPKLWSKNLFDLILKPIGRKTNSEGRQQTLCKVYSGETLKPLGLHEVLLLREDDPLRKKHSELEKKFKDRIRAKKGKSSFGMDPKELFESAKLLSNLAFGLDKISYNKLTSKQRKILKHYGKENLKNTFSTNAESFPGSEHQQNRILEEVWNDVQNAKLDQKIDINTKKEELRREKLKKLAEERKRKELETEKEKKQKLKAKQKSLKEKEEKKALHQEFLMKQRVSQSNLIDDCIYFYDLYTRKVSNLIIKYYFFEKGIHKDNIDYFLVKTLETVILNQSEDNISFDEENSLFSINEDSEKFIFDEKLALEQISQKNRNSKIKVSWEIMVQVYELKKQGLTNDLILEKLASKNIKIAKSSLNNYNKIIQGEISRLMGNAYEKFRTEKLKIKYPQAKVSNLGKKSESDILILHSNKKLDIISAKCYRISPSKSTHTFFITKELGPEFRHAKKKKQNFILDFYNPLNNVHNTKEIITSQISNKSQIRLSFRGEIEISY